MIEQTFAPQTTKAIPCESKACGYLRAFAASAQVLSASSSSRRTRTSSPCTPCQQNNLTSSTPHVAVSSRPEPREARTHERKGKLKITVKFAVCCFISKVMQMATLTVILTSTPPSGFAPLVQVNVNSWAKTPCVRVFDDSIGVF